MADNTPGWLIRLNACLKAQLDNTFCRHYITSITSHGGTEYYLHANYIYTPFTRFGVILISKNPAPFGVFTLGSCSDEQLSAFALGLITAMVRVAGVPMQYDGVANKSAEYLFKYADSQGFGEVMKFNDR